MVAIGEDSRWRDRVSSRWLLGRPFNPGRHAKRLHCPWLVCVGAADQVARPAAAIAAARRAPSGELRLYPGVDHFDIYDGPEHEAVLADQLAFLERHVLTDRAAAGRLSAPVGLDSSVTAQGTARRPAILVCGGAGPGVRWCRCDRDPDSTQAA